MFLKFLLTFQSVGMLLTFPRLLLTATDFGDGTCSYVHISFSLEYIPRIPVVSYTRTEFEYQESQLLLLALLRSSTEAHPSLC